MCACVDRVSPAYPNPGVYIKAAEARRLRDVTLISRCPVSVVTRRKAAATASKRFHQQEMVASLGSGRKQGGGGGSGAIRFSLDMAVVFLFPCTTFCLM